MTSSFVDKVEKDSDDMFNLLIDLKWSTDTKNGFSEEMKCQIRYNYILDYEGLFDANGNYINMDNYIKALNKYKDCYFIRYDNEKINELVNIRSMRMLEDWRFGRKRQRLSEQQDD